MAARGNASTPTVSIADLERLRNDWERLAAEAAQAARTAPAEKRAGLQGQARSQSACAADLNDLILGRGHPSARRS